MEPQGLPSDIAVIGIACRLPGGASSPAKFWEFLSEGRSAYSEVPPDRYNVDAFHHPADEKLNTTRPRGGHFLLEDVAAFDAPFFSISAQEAKAMDPMQRVLLETTYESLENAGLPIQTLAGSNTSCYVGAFTRDYHEMLTRDAETAPMYMITGTGFSLLANRVSWFYDFRGPSMTLDTACSSSLVALHLACQSLRAGESSLAVVSGANLIISPDTIMWLSNMRMVSKGGKSKSFDDSADGYGRGEGFVTVILKPLQTAIRDGDMIRAVIRGTGVNQDGHTVGITSPNARAQADLIELTYRAAGLDYRDTGYFEAHGTGTKAGDPLEMQAISHTLCADREPGNEMFVGSVKSNIGHLEGAAGLAGLLKAILMIERGAIVPSIHFQKPNRRIPLDLWRIKVPTSLGNWPSQGLRRASVNSFGYGGTNAHAILDSAYHFLATRGLQGNHHSHGHALSNGAREDHQPATQNRVFVLSARSEEALKGMRIRYHDWLQSLNFAGAAESEDSFLDRLALTLNQRRSLLEWRTYAVAASVQELRENLISPTFDSKRSSSPPKLAFIFTGQGAQWARMGQGLLQYPAFRASLEEAESYLRSSLGCEWSVLEELARDERESRIHLAMFSQPLCTILQVALVDLLSTWNISPAAVLGHSSGEIAAAYCCSAISRVDAWKIAYERGKLSSGLKTQAPELKGGMIAVGLSSAQATQYIHSVQPGRLVVACINSPTSVTVSGDEAAIDQLEILLRGDSVFCQRLKVENAYHSPHMEAIADEYRRLISSITPKVPQPGSAVMISSVTECPVAHSELGPDYWVKNLTSPVLFSGAVQNLLTQNSKRRQRTSGPSFNILLEVGPHSALKGPLRQILAQQGLPDIAYGSVLIRRENATQTAAKVAGMLHTNGAPVKLSCINMTATGTKLLVDLPSYPWNHTVRYWSESRLSKSYRFRKYARSDLLGVPVSDFNKQEPRWRNFLRVSDLPWIRDHVVHSSMLYPAAGVLSMVLEAIQQIPSDSSAARVKNIRLRDVRVGKAILIPDDQSTVECILQLRQQRTGRTDASTGWWEFSVFTCQEDESLEENARGLVTVERESESTVDSKRLAAQRLRASYQDSKSACKRSIEPEAFYRATKTAGLHYGPTFQNLVEIHAGPSQSCWMLEVPNTKAVMPAGIESGSLIHPATLDCVIHSLFAALDDGKLDFQNAAVPVSFDGLVISADIPSGANARMSGFCQAMRDESGGIVANIGMFDPASNEPKLQITGMRCKELPSLGSHGFSHGPVTKRPFGTLVWKPDITLLDDDALVRYLDSSHAAPTVEDKVGNPSGPADAPDERRMEYVKAWESDIGQIVDLAMHKNPELSVLQVGTGPGPLIPLAMMEERFRDSGHRMTFSAFDTQADNKPELQGKSFDIIIIIPGANETKTGELLDWCLTLAKPQGRVLAVDMALHTTDLSSEGANGMDHNLINGLTQSLTSTVSHSTHLSKTLSTPNGVRQSNLRIFTAAAAGHQQSEYPKAMYILQPSTVSDKVSNMTTEIVRSLCRKGVAADTVTWPIDLSELQGRPVICLLELEEPILSTIGPEDFELLRKMVLDTSSLLWVTMGENPLMATVVGFLRSIQNESTHLDLCQVHLEDAVPSRQPNQAEMVSRIALEHGAEREYSEVKGILEINRWVAHEGMNRLLLDPEDDGPACESVALGQVQRGLKRVSGSPERLETAYFVLDDGAGIDLAADEVEIATHAVGISLQNTVEVSGTVKRVGKGCSRFRPGDRLWGLSLGSDSWGSVCRTKEHLCHVIPPEISFQDAVAWFLPFALAYYSLSSQARLQPGQTILVQAAAGVVGQAAIQLAGRSKASILATTRIKEDRVLIESLGVPIDHIFQDNDPGLAAELAAASADKGVDVILSTSLRGERLGQVWNCIAPSGVFLDLSGDDVAHDSSLDLAPFRRGASFSCVAMSAVVEAIPSLMDNVMNDITTFLQRTQPLPTFSVSRIAEASKLIHQEQSKKVIVTLSATDEVPVSLSAINPLVLDGTGTYLLAGGLGGLGKSLARLLVANGARFLAMLSRSGPNTDKAMALMQELNALGATIKIYACDVSDSTALKNTIHRLSTELPPIKGAIQGAMVLNDAIYETMSHTQWQGTIQPKVQGSWLLHELLPRAMDFFIMLSSISGVVGNPGQANYAAGNAFQDQLACHRRKHGLPAVSLDLGLMLGIGVVAEKGGHQSLQKWESVGINEQEFHALMKVAMAGYLGLQECPGQLILGLPTGGLVHHHELETPSYFSNPRFSFLKSMGLRENQDDEETSSLAKANPLPMQISSAKSIQEVSALISQALCLKVAESLHTPVENIDANKALRTYGVDSLSAAEVRNWVVREIQSSVSVFDVLSNMSITALASKIAVASKLLQSDLQ